MKISEIGVESREKHHSAGQVRAALLVLGARDELGGGESRGASCELVGYVHV
jgi:hypothetical protein